MTQHHLSPVAPNSGSPPNRAACTIIAKNYLAFARALAESFLQHHPGADFYVLVVDDCEGFIPPADEPFKLIKAPELRIADFPCMAFKYDVVELSTAVKPFLLEHLFDVHGAKEVLYIDPDILVLNSLDPLFESFRDHDVVLTPHTTEDFPDDKLSPGDSVLLLSGIYNLGFIGVRDSDNTRRFLTWWQHKLRDHCVIDPLRGYFVDQKFIDLAPLFFSGIHVERGCGYNVAYWNLHARRLSHENACWTCNDEPLRFYHFSGFNPDDPQKLCRHSPRYTLTNRPDAAPLFRDYRELVLRHGHAACSRWPYTFATFADGTRIHPEFRRVFRKSLESQDARTVRIENPFSSKMLLSQYKRWHFRFTKPIRNLPMRVVRYAGRRLGKLLGGP